MLTLVSHCYTSRYDYAPEPYAHGSMEVFDWSNLQDADRSRVGDHPWLSFLEGNNPDYPIAAMQEDFVELRSKLEDMRNDPTTPDTVRIEQPPFDPSPPPLTRGGLAAALRQPEPLQPLP